MLAVPSYIEEVIVGIPTAIMRTQKNRNAARTAVLMWCHVVLGAAWVLMMMLVHHAILDAQVITPAIEILSGLAIAFSALYFVRSSAWQTSTPAQLAEDQPTRDHLLKQTQEAYETLKIAFERQQRDAALLEKVRMALAGEMDVSALTRTLVESVAATFGYTQVSLFLRKGDDLVLQHQVGYEEVIDRVPITLGVIGKALRSRQPIFLENVAQATEYLVASPETVSEIAVPLSDRDEAIGVFNIETVNGTKLTEADFNVLVKLGAHIEVALSRARLYTELRQSEETFRQIFENAPIAVVITGLDTRVQRFNRAALELLGYSEQEMLSMKLQDFGHVDDDYRNTKLRLALLRGEMSYFRMDKRFISKSGKIINGMLQVALIHDGQGKPIQLVGQIVDMSSVRQAQRMLENLNADLELRVEERTRELKTANDRLIQLDALKSKFVADVSHELRTPVAGIATRAYLLERDTSANFPEHVAALKQQASRLKQLLDDILDFARLEGTPKQTLFFEPVNLNSLAEALKPTYTARAQEAGLQLVYSLTLETLLINGSDEHLVRMLTNLLDNALKYTPTGRITVYSYCDLERGQAVLEISDTGRGIAAEDLAHLFERFYRGRDVGSSNIPGTGLGLARVKEIITAHDGDIEAESTLGVGSLFRVRLPLAKSESVALTALPNPAFGSLTVGK
jgi:PAS domain S-box-containing protein